MSSDDDTPPGAPDTSRPNPNDPVTEGDKKPPPTGTPNPGALETYDDPPQGDTPIF